MRHIQFDELQSFPRRGAPPRTSLPPPVIIFVATVWESATTGWKGGGGSVGGGELGALPEFDDSFLARGQDHVVVEVVHKFTLLILCVIF